MRRLTLTAGREGAGSTSVAHGYEGRWAVTGIGIEPEGLREAAISPLRGLTGAEVAARIAAGQTNAFRPRTSRTYRDIARDNLINPFNVTLAALVAILVAMGQVGDSLFSGFAVVGNTAVAIVQETRAKRQLDRLARLAERTARVIRDGESVTVTEREIVQGDLVRLGPGDRVPVDGPIVAADALEVSESLITGESEPVAKAPGEALTSGSYVVAGTCFFEAERVGAASFVNSLGQLASQLKVERTPLQVKIDAIVWISVLGMCLFAPLYLVASVRTGKPLDDLVRDAISLVTTFVPQGVVLATTVALAFGAVRVGRQRTLVQRLNAVESMANVTVLCLDKTGTLTRNEISVVRLVPLGDGSEAELTAGLRRYLGSVSSMNPTAEAIAATVDVEVGGSQADKVGEVAFSSARKWGAVLYGDGSAGILGAPEFLLDDVDRRQADVLAAAGHRVLAFAAAGDPAQTDASRGSPASVALAERRLPDGRSPLGLIVLQDPLRPDIRETLAGLASREISLKVLSGDGPVTVGSIAAQAGIESDGEPITGPELAGMDEAAFAQAVRGHSIFARVTPDLKRRIVLRLRADGAYVAMVGDGVNDVPALKAARLGIAMAAGAQMAKDVAELVLLDNDLRTLPNALDQGTSTIEKAYATCRIFLSKNLYMVLMFILVGYGGLPFPAQVRELSWATFIAAAVPTTLIACDLIRPKPVRLFVRDVVGYILVNGIFGAILLTAAYVFAIVWSGDDVDLSRSFVILFASAYGVLIFWDACGLVPTQPRTMRQRPGTALVGTVIAIVAVFSPQLLPGFFRATVLPPVYWVIFAATMLPVLFLFRRLVAERASLIQPLRTLLSGR